MAILFICLYYLHMGVDTKSNFLAWLSYGDFTFSSLTMQIMLISIWLKCLQGGCCSEFDKDTLNE